jgi:hypothetical protein
MLEHEAAGLRMLAESLRGCTKAHAQGHALGLQEAADKIRVMQDIAINDAADYFAELDLGEMKVEAAERAEDGGW